MAKSNYMDYMSDHEIVRRLANRDKKACEHLYKFRPSFRKWILQCGGTREEADNIFQDFMLSLIIYVERGCMSLDVNLEGFVIRSLKNRWLNELKKRKEKLNSIDENFHGASSDPDPMQNLVNKELTEKIRKAIAKLNERNQIIIQMFMENYKDKEIAQELNSTAASIRTERHRAFKKLMDLLK